MARRDDEHSAGRAQPQEPVAIIGLHGRFPGADDPSAFWDVLVRGSDVVGPPSAERLGLVGHPPPSESSRIEVGGFIADVDAFDGRFFAIPDPEARRMDPVQRLALEVAWHCVEEAGYRVADLAATETGVFVAAGKSDYEELLHRAGAAVEATSATGTAASIIANRISFALGLTGPSLSVDTACSGSLVALHVAARSLQAGDCAAALVGGVNLVLTSSLTASLAKEGALSPDGRTRSFDARANGYGRGEGLVFVLVKRLADAKRDRDRIHGVLRGSAVGHGGRAAWLTAPNAGAQAAVIEKAVRRSGVDPRTITYVEAHGTATPIGDPIEFNALRGAFEALAVDRSAAGPAHRCAVSTVKANVGHLEAAAGLAGVAKVLLAMQHGFLPGHPHLSVVNDLCRAEGTPFHILSQGQPWACAADGDESATPRRAGVSAFGFGGVVAHAVLEEHVGGPTGADRSSDDATMPILPISASDGAALRRYAARLHAFAAGQAAADAAQRSPVEDLLTTFQTARAVLPARCAVVGADWPALAASLLRFLADEDHPTVIRDGDAGLSEEPEGDRLEQLSIAFARRWVGKQAVDFRTVNGGRRPGRRAAPLYPFARSRHWFDRPSVPHDGAVSAQDGRRT